MTGQKADRTKMSRIPVMRLSSKNVEVIKDEIENMFGEVAQVWLFGSRVDDASRGGDIDLLVEADAGRRRCIQQECGCMPAWCVV